MSDTLALNLAKQKPLGLVHNNQLSTSASYVISSIKREIYPTSQVDYSYDTNNIMEFRLSSVDQFLKDAWLQFNLVVSGQVHSSLEEGGLSQLFRRVEVLDIAGRSLDTIDEYALQKNLESQLKFKSSSIENKMWSSGDGMDKPWIEDAWDQATQTAIHVNATVSIQNNEILNIDGGAANSEFLVGQPVRIVRKADQVVKYEGICHSVDSNTVIKVAPIMPAYLNSNMNTPSTAYEVQVARLSPRYELSIPGAAYQVAMPIDFSFFRINEDLPLFVFEGVILRFHLNAPYRTFNTIDPHYTTNGIPNPKTLDYQIKNARLVAVLRKGSAEIMSDYRSMFMGGGIDYMYPAYEVVSRPENGAEANAYQFDLPIAKASVRRVLFVVQNVLSKSATDGTTLQTCAYTHPSNTFVDASISSYQFKIGGANYPDLKVDITDDLMIQAYEELKRSLGVLHNPLIEFRFGMDKWARMNRGWDTTVTYDQSHKAIFGTTFSTVDYDLMSGIRTKGRGTDNHIICDVALDGQHLVNGATSTRYFTFFFEYAKLLRLGSSSGVVTLE